MILLFTYQKNIFSFGENILAFETNLSKSLEKHTHDFIEIAYILQGEVWHTINGQKNFLKKGDYVVVDFNTIHSFDIIDKKTLRIMNCVFTPDLIDTSLKACRNIRQLLNNYLITFDCMISDENKLNFQDENNDILDLLKKIENEYNNKKNGYIQIIRSNLIEIIIKTMRKYQKMENSKNNSNQSVDNIYILKKYIDSNYTKNSSLDKLAEELNLSKNYISHYFKKSTGITISHYIQKARIANACRLLINTNYKVSKFAAHHLNNITLKI